MTPLQLTRTLLSPDETAQLARAIGASLNAGDCLLLKGGIGAGKTHFARNLIQPLLKVIEDVPSPTFTLVQAYETIRCELWHADLYRLTSPDEIEELGLTDAFDDAICLVEWPEKLGDAAPDHALSILLETQPGDQDHRLVTLRWKDPKWTRKLEPLTHD